MSVCARRVALLGLALPAVLGLGTACDDAGSGTTGPPAGRDQNLPPVIPTDANFVDARVDLRVWPADAAPDAERPPEPADASVRPHDAEPPPDPPDALPECRLNSDCPPGQYCGEGRCTFDCREARDCDDGERCVNGLCEVAGPDPDAGLPPPPRDCRDTGCAAGQTCNEATGRCEVPVGPPDGRLGAECVADADCESHFCAGLGVAGQPHFFCSYLCCSEGECPIGFACGSGGGPRFCIPSTVFPNGAYSFDAAAGQSCGRGGGACQSMLCDTGDDRCLPTCCTDRDCGGRACVWQPTGNGQAQICDINLLGFGRTGEPCGSEFDCQSMVCLFGPNGPVCGDMCCSNADCPGGTACQQVINPVGDYIMACGPSTPGEAPQGEGCASDAGCQSGLCIRGQCEDTCCEDAHCPAGHMCTLTDNGEGGAIRVCRPRP
ncbi:hypothetical protein L6V77_20155 [Myxococcota bacterium]|nr:hypothetical protein [Myxococcota bacterium]